MTDARSVDFDEVLERILLEEEQPAYDALVRWCKAYPQFRDELSEYFVTWAHVLRRQSALGPVVNEDAIASRAVSRALDILHRQRAVEGNECEELGREVNDQLRLKQGERRSGLTVSLLDHAKAIGLSPESLAERIRVDDSMLQKLNRGLVTHVPRALVEMIVIELRKPYELAKTMVTGPPRWVLAGRHKTKRKPSVTTEDFEQAVISSSLSEDDRLFWLEVARKEAEESD